MKQTHQWKKAAAVAVMGLAAAMMGPLAQAQAPAKPGGAMPVQGMAGSSSMPAGGMDMKAQMKDMCDKMSSMPMTGNPDVDFARMMRIHHIGAVAMAEPELSAGKDPQMKKMAKAIISAQKKEIAEFDKFLAKHGQPTGKASR